MAGRLSATATQALSTWLEAQPDAAAWIGPDGLYRYANQAYCKVLGLPLDELTAAEHPAPLREILLPRLRDGAPLAAHLEQCREPVPVLVELRLCEAGETPRIWCYRYQPLTGPTGPLGWREDLLEITAGEQLKASRVEAAGTLEQLRGEMQRRLAEKDQTIARVSHELRTPMSAIFGFCHMLLHYAGSLEPRQHDYVHKILKNASILLQLLNNLLDISRIAAGPLPLVAEQVDLSALLDDALETVEPQSWERDLAIHTSVADNLPQPVTDRLKVKQILINLMANAVKYTEHGEVTVSIEAEGDGIRFTVADTGCGIPADQIDRIFEPYTQVSGAQRPGVIGTGLGLAICEKLVHRLGGQIGVESTPGVGSVFTVWLPLTAPEAEPTGPAPTVPGSA